MEAKFNILNRCFTKNWLNACLQNSNNRLYLEMINRFIKTDDISNGEVVSRLYDLMLKEYRNEYIYKNTILNKILLKKHNPKTTIALSEFRICNSIADFVMINGKGSVYEVKTELDNLDRLKEQISDYYKAFSYVSIVTHRKNFNELIKYVDSINPNVGIYVFKRKSIQEYRAPIKYDSQLDYEVMFKMLRKKEFEDIIIKMGAKLPNVSQFEYYSNCKNVFAHFDIIELQKKVMNELKMRGKIDASLLEIIPYELKFLCYTMNVSEKDFQRISNFLDMNIKTK